MEALGFGGVSSPIRCLDEPWVDSSLLPLSRRKIKQVKRASKIFISLKREGQGFSKLLLVDPDPQDVGSSK